MKSPFKAYDIRGEIGVSIDEAFFYRVARSVAQHFSARSVIIGFDARETSPTFSVAASDGVRDGGADALNIGLAGTEEMYWAVTEFGACAGIEITASHNPINYNGMKIVKSNSCPLSDLNDFQVIKSLAESEAWVQNLEIGRSFDVRTRAREAYVRRVLSFIDTDGLNPLRIVVNSGNGAAGPTFDAIAEGLKSLRAPFEFIRVHHNPDSKFPNGIPNPLLSENHYATAQVVKKFGADFGVAFDGDFDRCFFFDEKGSFIPSEYVVGLLASVFLQKEPGAKIVHDPRIIWNTQDVVSKNGGVTIQSRTGHAFIKEKMRAEEAIYGGEISAHHYFRDFAYCDSGMIPWIIVAELVSRSNLSLGGLVQDRFAAFPSSGETNFHVTDPNQAINNVLAAYRKDALSIDTIDGVSLAFHDWRFNIRKSNTEPLIRLNIEVKGEGKELLKSKVDELSALIRKVSG